MYTIVKTWTAPDGSRMVEYIDRNNYRNTVPLYIYRRMIRKK